MMPENERQKYALYSRLRQFGYKVQQAQRIADRGFEMISRPYASMSFGKDSTVMIHLLWQMRPHLPVMYVNCGRWDEWPDTPRVKQDFLSLFPGCNFIELSAPSIMEFYKQAGFYIQDEEDNPQARKAQREYGDSLADVLDGEAKRRDFDGSFIGCRKEESDNRRRLFAMHGPLYFAKTRGMWACHPLAFWSSKDIWAYIVKHDLPYNELYDLDPQGRELARNGAMFGTRSARYGRLSFIRQMYPDWFNRFAAQFPGARGYI